MKISILVWNLSMHSIVRTYPIAKVLERHHQVELIGPVLGDGIYQPYRDEFTYKAVTPKKVRFPEFIPSIRSLIRLIDGDVMYAFKPMPTSFGVATLAKLVKRKPLILDIEDWDAESFLHQPLRRKVYQTFRSMHYPLNGSYLWLMEKLTKFADNITVVSNFLQDRFGGVKLPHGADCYTFDPNCYDERKSRHDWGWEGKNVILFAGTAVPHKGVGDLCKAISLVDDDHTQIAVVGKETQYLRKLMQRWGEKVKYYGLYPHTEMPEILSMADLIVLPQRDLPYAQAQVPGKVFEAMAMAKPIIATNVSDLPEILEGCGWIVEPENPDQLAEKIQYVLDHPAEANEKGKKARQKCKAKYSYEAMEKTLLSIFEQYE